VPAVAVVVDHKLKYRSLWWYVGKDVLHDQQLSGAVECMIGYVHMKGFTHFLTEMNGKKTICEDVCFDEHNENSIRAIEFVFEFKYSGPVVCSKSRGYLLRVEPVNEQSDWTLVSDPVFVPLSSQRTREVFRMVTQQRFV
jgi:hypothetical protein